MPELLKQYAEPDAEIVGAVSFSELSLRLVELSAAFDLTPLRGAFKKLGKYFEDSGFHADHSWPHPGWKTLRDLARASLLMVGTGLAGNRELTRPVQIRRYNHHLTHAALGCYSSPFPEAVCAVIDGYGEFGSTGFYSYREGRIEPLHPPRTPFRVERASLGFFYGLVCGLCGFDPLKGEEWKVMGLAPYGRVDPVLYRMLKSLIKVGDLQLVPGLPIEEEKRLIKQLKELRRAPGAPPIEAANIACTGQQVFADLMRELLQALSGKGISSNLVLCGGCALNSSYNGHILAEGAFRSLHVPSAPSDDGNSVGAALLAYHADHPGAPPPRRLLSPYLGSGISKEARDNLLRFNRSPRLRHLPDTVVAETAELLAKGKIIGWMQGRAEFGPRALGNRSILADPRSPDMKDRINGRVKFREEYRPFAPSILHECGPEYFENYQMSPYMERTLVFRPEVRAKVPAVVHEDGTGRLQSVTPELAEKFYRLIRAFYALTGVPLLLNTSFNIMGKPIIHSVEDAMGLFHTTGLDALVIDDILIEKEEASLAN
ncbi:MAG: carbamoyltransferase C-terminal domain-containing protein [Polyangia bacterium]